MANLFIVPQVVGIRGGSASATAEFYVSGDTDTPQNVYSDVDLSASLGNEISADGTGRFTGVYLQSSTYTIVVKVDGVTLYTQDNISGDDSFVKYSVQTLTDAQKLQSRTNIDVPSTADMTAIEARADFLESAAASNTAIYKTTTAGLAAVGEGELFQAPDAVTGELVLYEDVSGVATERGRVSNLVSIEGVVYDGLSRLDDNELTNGFFDTGQPDLTITTDTVDITLPEMTSRGLTKGISLPAGGGFARKNYGEDIQNDWIVALQTIYCTNDTYRTSTAVSRTAALSLSALGSIEKTSTFIGDNTIIAAYKGQVTQASAEIIDFGNNSDGGSGDERIVTGYWIEKSSTEPVLADVVEGYRAGLAMRQAAAAAAENYALNNPTPQTQYSADVVFNSGSSLGTYTSGTDGTDVHKVVFDPFQETYSSVDVARTFEIAKHIVGAREVSYTGDDTAPIRLSSPNALLCGGHGYYITKFAAAGHGLTASNLAEEFTDGSNPALLLQITGDDLYLARIASQTVLPTGGYTSATGSFTATAATSVQYYPFCSTYSIENFVDGTAQDLTSYTGTFSKFVSVKEVYDVLDYADIISDIQTTGAAAITAPSGDPLFRLTNVYHFDRTGGIVLDFEIYAYQDVGIDDIMGVQAGLIGTGDGDRQIYVPRVVDTITHESTDYNFNVPSDYGSDESWASYLNFTPSTFADANDPPSRAVMLTDNYGLDIGYLPEFDGAPAKRALLTTTKALALATTGKVYPQLVDKGNHTLSAGGRYKGRCYRHAFRRGTGDSANRTVSYALRAPGAYYYQLDWHGAINDVVTLPPDFAGLTPEIVRCGPNVSVLDIGTSVKVSVDAGRPYGELLVRFT